MHSSRSGPPLGLDVNGRPTTTGIAIGLFSAALMLTFDAVVVSAAARQLWTFTYETTTGTVRSNEVNRTSGKGRNRYEVHPTYSYYVGKDEYLGHAVRYGLSTSFRDEAQAKTAFPDNSKVVVYYNRKDPGDSVLLRGLQDSDLTWALFLLPFNLVFGMFGLATILYLITPAKCKAKWDFVPTSDRSIDDCIDSTLPDEPISPLAAAIAAAGITAFFAVFLIGFAAEMIDPRFSFGIVGWCAVLVVAAVVYFKVRQSRKSISAPCC